MSIAFLIPALVATQGAVLSPQAQQLFDKAYETMKKGDSAAAVKLYQQASELAPESWDIWLEYTSALRQAGRLQAAARAGWRTVELRPTHPHSWTNLGNVFLQARHLEAMWTVLEEAARIAPKDPAIARGMTNMGFSAWQEGDYPLAERAFNRALELSPNQLTAKIDFAAMRLSLGRKDARKDLQDARKMADSAGDKGLVLWADSLLGLETKPGGIKPPLASWQWEELPEALRHRPLPGTAATLGHDSSRRHCIRHAGGTIRLSYPADWRIQAPKNIPDTGAPSIRISPEASDQFNVMLTLLPPAKPEKALNQDTAKNIVASGFPGSGVTLHWLVQPRGAMAFARDPAWKPGTPGDFPNLLQAVIQVGNTWAVSSLFWGDTQKDPPAALLSIVESLTWSTP